MTLENRFQAIRDKVSEVLHRAEVLYGVKINPEISFELRGRVAGYAILETHMGVRKYGLKFNRDMIMGDSFEYILNQTVSHEIAHLVCYHSPVLGCNHDQGWRRVCITLGGSGLRCHDRPAEYAAGGIVYTTTSGKEIVVSKHRHTKIQNGFTYTVRNGGGKLDKTCRWTPEKVKIAA